MEPRLAEPRAFADAEASREAPTGPSSSQSPRSARGLVLGALPWLIMLATVAALAVGFWPGRMNADTLNEIMSAKTGIYNNQYTPILEAMWHPFYTIGIGPGWVLAGQVLLFIVSAFVLLRMAFRPIGAAIAVCIICLSPQVFGELGLVGRDTWFLAFLTACFACTSRVITTGGRTSRWWALGALVFAWLTLASRQNAAASVFVPLGLIAGLWLIRRGHGSRRVRLVIGSLAIGIVVTLVMMGTQSLLTRALDVRNTHSIGQLYLYDLSDMSRVDRRDYVPRSVYPRGSVQSLDRLTGVSDSLALIAGPHHPIPYPFTGKVETALRDRWVHEIVHDPGTYLRTRLDEMGWTLGLTHDQVWIYHPYIDRNPFGFSTTFPWANRIANHFETPFTNSINNGGLLFAPWIYLLICCAAFIAGVVRRSPTRVIMGAIGLAAVTYQVGLFFGLLGPNYRYEFPCIAMTEIIIAVGLRSGWQRVRQDGWRGIRDSGEMSSGSRAVTSG